MISLETIVNETEKHYKIPLGSILSRVKSVSIAHARQVSMYIAAKLTNKSYVEMGSYFQRHHATIIYALQKITRDLKEKGPHTKPYQEVKSLYDKLKGDLDD